MSDFDYTNTTAWRIAEMKMEMGDIWLSMADGARWRWLGRLCLRRGLKLTLSAYGDMKRLRALAEICVFCGGWGVCPVCASEEI